MGKRSKWLGAVVLGSALGAFTLGGGLAPAVADEYPGACGHAEYDGENQTPFLDYCGRECPDGGGASGTLLEPYSVWVCVTGL